MTDYTEAAQPFVIQVEAIFDQIKHRAERHRMTRELFDAFAAQARAEGHDWVAQHGGVQALARKLAAAEALVDYISQDCVGHDESCECAACEALADYRDAK